MFKDHFTNVNFNIVLVNNFTIGSFFKYKDRIPSAMQASLVYKYRCSLCDSQYVGSTIRTLATRVAEHSGRSYRSGDFLPHPPHSSVRLHATQCDVPVKLDNFSIIGSSNNSFELRILESLHIFRDKPSLNESQSAFPLLLVNV